MVSAQDVRSCPVPAVAQLAHAVLLVSRAVGGRLASRYISASRDLGKPLGLGHEGTGDFEQSARAQCMIGADRLQLRGRCTTSALTATANTELGPHDTRLARDRQGRLCGLPPSLLVLMQTV